MTFTAIYLLSVISININLREKRECPNVHMVIYHMVMNILNITLHLKFSLGYSCNYCFTLINIHNKNI